MNETSLIPVEPLPVVTFGNDKLDLLKRTIAKGTTDDQFALFVEVCKRTRLDPFAKQIYAVVRHVSVEKGGRWVKEPEMTIQTGIDGYRLICQRAGNYAGMDGPYWCGPDGEWRDVWLEAEPPSAAKVGVRAHGDTDWTYHIATYREYVQYTGRDKERRPNSMWANMPANQLAKCAEAGARRKRWAAELALVYVDAEAAAIKTVSDTEQERRLDAVANEPKAVMQPKRKSERAALAEAPAEPEPSPPADAIEGDFTFDESPGADEDPVVAWGHFWNSLPETLDPLGKSLGDVGMVLNCEPSAPGIKKWFLAQQGDQMAALKAALARA